MSWEGHWITLHNWTNGTEARVFVPSSGVVSLAQARRVRRKLAPSGAPSAGGALGEDGAQLPPQTPGWEYTAHQASDCIMLSASKYEEDISDSDLLCDCVANIVEQAIYSSVEKSDPRADSVNQACFNIAADAAKAMCSKFKISYPKEARGGQA